MLRVTNMAVSGKMPIKERLDYKHIIKSSSWVWLIRNEDCSPILSINIPRENKEKNVKRKPKSIYVSIWHSGAINIVGVKSFQEAKKIYSSVVKELIGIKAIELLGAEQ